MEPGEVCPVRRIPDRPVRRRRAAPVLGDDEPDGGEAPHRGGACRHREPGRDRLSPGGDAEAEGKLPLGRADRALRGRAGRRGGRMVLLLRGPRKALHPDSRGQKVTAAHRD